MSPALDLPEPIENVLAATARSKPELVAPEPEHCPGPESAQAGKADSCAGCPNQSVCASAPKGPDPDLPLIAARLSSVRQKILVLSGKGGVGKSTFTTMLAHALAGDPGRTVGVMDADVTGPSIPTMMGTVGQEIHLSAQGMSPVWVTDNLGVVSIQYMLKDRDSAVIWRGAKKNGLLKRFLKDVDWGAEGLDFLLIDTPPGTTDEHLSVTTFLRDGGGISGAIVVSTPQEVALLDVRKELDFCRKAGIRVLGLVENMSGFVCPGCRHENQIFRATTGGARSLAEEVGVPFLGSVPLDPKIGLACDYGEDYLNAYWGSPAAKAFMRVVERLGEELGVDMGTDYGDG